MKLWREKTKERQRERERETYRERKMYTHTHAHTRNIHTAHTRKHTHMHTNTPTHIHTYPHEVGVLCKLWVNVEEDGHVNLLVGVEPLLLKAEALDLVKVLPCLQTVESACVRVCVRACVRACVL